MGDVIKEIEMTKNKTASGGIDLKLLPESAFCKNRTIAAYDRWPYRMTQ